jgi:hypothetical protein
VAEFSGLDLRTSRRNIPWSSVVIATLIWAPLAWLTYHLVAIGHPWYSILAAVPAGLFFAATIGMMTQKEELVPKDQKQLALDDVGDE